jgi:hypothetical protein
MVVQLSIPVGNVVSLLGLGYTTIEIHQSVDEGNSYQEITAGSVEPAELVSAEASTTFRVGGRMLKLQVDGGVEKIIEFSSLIDNWTPTQVKNRINEIVPGLATNDSTTVTLTSPTDGRSSSIVITYCDSEDLGWVEGDSAKGKAARLALDSDVLLYSFNDTGGASSARYKWRFSDGGENPISEFSEYVLGSAVPLLDASRISIATGTFVSFDGLPRKTTVIVSLARQSAQSVDGVFLGDGVAKTVTTDEYGYLQMPLVRGADIIVAIEGTRFVRRFTVPDAPTFDLLTVAADAPDEFTVQTTLPLLTRRSL